MRSLYPEIEPYDHGTLAVSERHALYYEQCGNPLGKPVVLLHGGPGAGCSPKMRRFHDPTRYRIVLFDQRGSGRSVPHAELAENTTWDLVADIERLRLHLGIARWQVFGGSWGSNPGPGLCANTPGARDRTGAARDLHAATLGTGMVLPGRLPSPVPRCLGALPCTDPDGGARRPDLGLSPPA
jgi:pimeloyl-ACP methyl ester carboxylesterase